MKIKKIFLTILFAIIFILVIQNKADASQILNNLDFEVQINSDGSMDVTETWDIYISETNTLFKTFELDSKKYSNIVDVSITETTDGINKKFTQIDEEMYHVTKDCYYALKNSSGFFEIAWGVGLDNSSDTRIYEISYKVKDAIAKYNDYAELYWKFVGEDFEISADKITGEIYLPGKAGSQSDILVWGHTEYLNGTINVTGLDEIQFEVTNFNSGRYVEVRTLFPKDLIQNTNRVYSYNIYEDAFQEETIWAEEANTRREQRGQYIRNVINSLIIIPLIGIIIIIIRLSTNIKLLKKIEKKYVPSTKYEYYRELPYEDATPAEAQFIMNDGKGYYADFSSSFSANILDLCLEKYVKLEVIEKKTTFSEGVVKISLLEKDDKYLKKDKKITLDFLKEVAGENKEITTKDIKKYLNRKISRIDELNKAVEEYIKDYTEKTGKYIKENDKLKEKTSVKLFLDVMIFFIILGIGIMMLCYYTRLNLKAGVIISSIGTILALINMILTNIVQGRINILTQKGIDEKSKWKAFKKYMEDFSLLKEKEVPELVLWEKYLVFATAFGISEKVLKQLKVVYPQIDDINSPIYSSFAYIHIMDSVDFATCMNSSVYSSIASSGSGAGGGFSGGGGGGRWPEVAAVADKW